MIVAGQSKFLVVVVVPGYSRYLARYPIVSTLLRCHHSTRNVNACWCMLRQQDFHAIHCTSILKEPLQTRDCAHTFAFGMRSVSDPDDNAAML